MTKIEKENKKYWDNVYHSSRISGGFVMTDSRLNKKDNKSKPSSEGEEVIMDITFDEWFKELQTLSMKLYGISIPNDHSEDWKECGYYLENYRPIDALNEDLGYE